MRPETPVPGDARPRVLLVGAFDAADPAADALCAVCCTALRGYDLLVASRTPAETARRHGVRTIPAGTAFVAAALRTCDALVVGGGTVFASRRSDSNGQPSTLLHALYAQLRVARARQVPFAMVGVGAGELTGETARRMTRWLVRHADLLVLRDEESAELLVEAGAPGPFWVGSDLAWCLSRNGTPAPAGVLRPSITVVPSAAPHRAAVTAPALAQALRELDGGYQLRLQSWPSTRSPLEPSDPLAELLEGDVASLAPPTALSDAVATYAGNDLVIAAPIPAQIAAGLAGSRLLALVDNAAAGSVARRLDQSTVPADAGPAELGAAIRAALAGAPVTESAVAAETSLAQKTLTFARLLVDRGDGEDVPDLQPVAMTVAGVSP